MAKKVSKSQYKQWAAELQQEIEGYDAQIADIEGRLNGGRAYSGDNISSERQMTGYGSQLQDRLDELKAQRDEAMSERNGYLQKSSFVSQRSKSSSQMAFAQS